MAPPGAEERYAPSGTSADAWVLYLLTARHALRGGEPDGPWLPWRELYRTHLLRARIVWWYQVLVLAGAWAAGSVVSVGALLLFALVGARQLLPFAFVPVTVATGIGAFTAAWPVLFPASLARRLGLPHGRDPPRRSG